MKWEKKLDLGKRESILYSAFNIFSEKGFHMTKIEEIAQHAGVGKGTVYEYFSSKEELLREMLKESILFYVNHVKNQMEAETSSDLKIRAFLQSHLQLIEKNKNMEQIFTRDFGFVNEELRKWLREQKKEFLRYIETVIENGIKNGVFRPIDKHIGARMVMCAAGAIYAVGEPIPKEKIDEIMEILQQGFFK
ncbi:TetR/AcrR family transcriptional regulator [Microaerobacter geothermalis]|uniref:TetR/AcrR family transcriptional regulator n=1 Tax=Microaerobacter geothermalis TaxID=674972 RepID=UPI001F279FB0|nr:TetR/AcrR family transcriptional regulator [Microaerobacter geothermalis]MCF6093632.1 TetR/AcrR family transcriptional regulator [Microaerobacter geothermalis]